MATTYSNPYTAIANLIWSALFSMGMVLPFTDEEGLITALENWAFGTFTWPETGGVPTSVLDDAEFRSNCNIAKNAYINNKVTVISPAQGVFINFLGYQFKFLLPSEIPDSFNSIEDEIEKSNLTMKEKQPLLLAIAVGRRSYDFWMWQINHIAPPPGPWHWADNYFNANSAVNLANLPSWVAAAMQAVLYFEFKGDYTTDPLRPPKMAGPDLVTAIVGSIMVSAGKVAFNWVPRVQIPELKLNMDIINDGIDKDPNRLTVCATACDGVIIGRCSCRNYVPPCPSPRLINI